MKRIIIFDFFGVIGHEISPVWFKNHFSIEEAKILKEKYFVDADLGLYTIDETLDRLSLDFNMKKEDIIEEWKSYVKPNEELLNKILKLKKNNKIYLLSNAAEGIFELLYPMIDFNTYFDKTFISYQHHIKKPDLKFYNLAIEEDKDATEIYFIDDNIENITCLEKTKIKGILFKNNKELFEILDKFI